MAKKQPRGSRTQSSAKSRVTSKQGTQKKGYQNLHELLILKLESLYDVEQELVKVLPKLAEHATDEDLREAFESHLEETKNHVLRLEAAMGLLGVAPKKEKVAGIRGINEDGSWVLKHVKGDAARDAALIGAAQYAEHYEIAGYISAREWAAMMDHDEVADLLDATLMEEQAATLKLAELAHNGINQRAGGIDMDRVEEETEVPIL